MEDQTVIIKIHEGDPLLNVSAASLTADSAVFGHLICDLGLMVLELEDFSPDTVCIFLTLLKDKQVGEIEEQHFRELHKLAVVFEVQWLVKECREWLEFKINCFDGGMEYGAQLFILEESRYILNKWKVDKFMDLMISKIAFMDITCFIVQYMENFDKLEPQQLDLMLKLGGNNTKVFLEILLQNVSHKQHLDKNTKYMLENINLSLCFLQEDQLYHKLFQTISELSEITPDDMKYALQLTTEATRTARSPIEHINNITLNENDKWNNVIESCFSLKYIANLVATNQINNMHIVIELVMFLYFRKLMKWEGCRCDHTTKMKLPLPSTENVEEFIQALEDSCCREKPLRKASKKHIDMMKSAMILSEQKIGKMLMNETNVLLGIIRDNYKLTSCHDNIVIESKLGTGDHEEIVHVHESSTSTKLGISVGSKELQRIMYKDAIYKHKFNFKHPGAHDCYLPGECGFILKEIQQGAHWTHQLCTEEKDYEGSGLHYHSIVCPEDIYCYVLWSGKKEDGTRVLLPGWWWTSWGWRIWRRFWSHLFGLNYWEEEVFCVAYNVRYPSRQYQAAKHNLIF